MGACVPFGSRQPLNATSVIRLSCALPDAMRPSAPPKTLPPVSPKSTAAAVVSGLQRGATRVVYPTYSLLPLELPAVGRLLAKVGGRRVDTQAALVTGT